MSEARASSRVWMGTLTFNPQEVFLIRTRAEVRSERRAVKWSELDEGAKFAALQVEAGRYVTLWLKRLRKAGHRFRYVITAESHVSGAPHFHIVLHELATPILKRVLEASWPFGFTKFKLVPSGEENRAVRYVTKYVAKNGASRIRASIRYGVGSEHGSDAAAFAAASVAAIDERGEAARLSPVSREKETPRSLGSALEERVWRSHLEEAWSVGSDPPQPASEDESRRRELKFTREDPAFNGPMPWGGIV